MRTTKRDLPSQPGFSPAWAAAWLERRGWKRDIAGDVDFDMAVKAMVAICANRSKGLLVIGAVGVGKTALAEIVRGASRMPTVRIDCGVSDSVDLLVPESDATLNGGVYNSGIDDLMERTVLIDDLGSERVVKAYGNELDRVGNFIVRYHARGKGRLLATTNLSGKAIEARYGARVLDRMLDMCIVLKLTGTSKRAREVVQGA